MQLLCNVDLQSIQVPTLGRPFSLGDLYDLKADAIVLGPKLWSSDHLANYTEHIQRTTKFEVSASQKTNDLKNIFDIDAWMSLSFLGGLVKVSGSAGYMDDRVTKSDIARVSLIFDTRTFTRELKPELFTKVDFDQVLEKVSFATHVVVGIQYGASAVFVFDRTVSSFETKRDVTGSMQASINSIPGIAIEGGASIGISEEEKKKVEKFSCKFHGDFVLKEHPGTYMEAIKVYKELPSYLGENYENSVPMTVWLYPLDALPISKESQVLHDIRNSLVHEITIRFEELNEMEVMSNDVLDSVVAQYSERIQKKVEEFKSHVHLFTLLLKQQMGKLLPQIRADGKQSLLAKVLADKESSPFAKVYLEEWMANVNQEVIVLDTTHRLPNYCRHDGDFDALLLNNKKYSFVLTLRLDDSRDNFIEEMAKYLDETKNVADYKSMIGSEQKWFNNQTLISDLQRKASSFAGFHAIEKAKTEQDVLKSDIQFLVREKIMTEGEHRGVTIEVYEYATLIDADYEIPSETGIPEVKTTSHNSITISWDEPRDGTKNIYYYKIDIFILENKKTDDKNQTSTLKKLTPFQTKGKVELIEITGLKPERAYMFIVSTFCKQGITAESKQSEFIRTLPCPKGMYYFKEQCFSCNPGYFSDITGALSCEKCPLGTQSGRGSSDCQACPKGTYAKDNQCQPCDPGKFAAQPGSSSCLECPIGFYSDSYGNEKCNRCPKGTVTLQPGAKFESECGGDVVQKVENTLNTFKMEINGRINRLHPELILIQNKNFRDTTAINLFANSRWADYKRGFGTPNGNAYWSGLENIYIMTHTGTYNLVIEFVWDKNQDGSTDPLAGTKARMEFKDFRVGSESEGYKLKIGEIVSKENMRESRDDVNWWMQDHNGRRFSTRDRDNDGYSGSCSQDRKGGWWFRSCGYYCLNCASDVIWDGGYTYRTPATSSMWLKRVD